MNLCILCNWIANCIKFRSCRRCTIWNKYKNILKPNQNEKYKKETTAFLQIMATSPARDDSYSENDSAVFSPSTNTIPSLQSSAG